MPGHTQLKALLQDGERMAKEIRRKVISEMSTKLKRIQRSSSTGVLCVLFWLFPALKLWKWNQPNFHEDLKTEDPKNRDGEGEESWEIQRWPESNF